MSKAVMISIRPLWCELIAQGMKTVEVRKTRPKLEPPFKCYIYCTKEKEFGDILWCSGTIGKMADKSNGKVIGEFVCDYITEITHGVDDDGTPYIDTGYVGCLDCLTYEEMETYLQGKTGYGWHISDLVIYDKPKRLSYFCSPCDKQLGCDCNYCKRHSGQKPITQPPQNWRYAEEAKTP